MIIKVIDKKAFFLIGFNAITRSYKLFSSWDVIIPDLTRNML